MSNLCIRLAPNAIFEALAEKHRRATLYKTSLGLTSPRSFPVRKGEDLVRRSRLIAIRSILCPAFSASSRQRLSSFSNALSSTASFFNGERSTPGTIPATSQFDWPISITAISVASCSRTTRDLLKSFSCGMGRSVDSLERRWCHCPRRSPHSIFFGAFHALAIDDGGTRTGFPLRLFTTLVIKRV